MTNPTINSIINNNMKYIINENGIVLFMNGQPQKVHRDDAKYAAIIAALRLPLADQDKAIEEVFIEADVNASMEEEGFKIDGDDVLYLGEPLPAPLAIKVRSLMRENLPVNLLVKFWENLKLNPSYSSVTELYDFLSYKELPITEDGCFIAYRGLQEDYYSVSGNLSTKVLEGVVNSKGQIYNGVGETIVIARNSCDDDRSRTCSYGIHAGSHDYAKNWSRGKLVAVKINPKDVVSVPRDYHCQKLRCCAYTVVAEITEEILRAATDSKGNPLQDVAFAENVKARSSFIERVQSYIYKKLVNGSKMITFKAIQSSFSPECPSMAEITDAVNTLGYFWRYKEGGNSKEIWFS